MMLQQGARPVPNYPDYVLIRKLGAGAFGKVWHAHGPGGLDVALKFIPRVRPQELRSLDETRKIRHPNLVSLFDAWFKEDCLILAMELCDRSLQEQLAAALHQNLPGIRPKELLSYMSDAANGLDALNQQAQHRDVKPANLLLLNSGVKVADFGLAKILEHTVASNSGAGTVAYMAPECFKGKIAQQSDQYSLAVTYYHLRTGNLLFKGDQAQMMYAHLELEPDLSKLWPGEAAVVARALSKEPGKRWSNCKTFVDELNEYFKAMVNKLVKAQKEALEEEHRRIMGVIGHAWDLVSRIWPEMARQVEEIRFIRVPKEARAVLAVRPSTGTLGIAIGCKKIAPDYLWHELVHIQQFLEGRLPPVERRTREQYMEIEREASSRQGQMLHSGVFERLQGMLDADQAQENSGRLTAPVRPAQPSNGVYPPPGVEPMEYNEYEWEMLNSVDSEDEERQPLPD